MPCKLGCGRCCEAIWLTVSVPRVKEVQAYYGTHPEDVTPDNLSEDWRHVVNHFHLITREEAVRINPLHKGRPNKGYAFVTCDWYDPDSKLCTHHDERPRICREFPFYGRKLESLTLYAEDCGYIGDIGKTQAEVAPFEPKVTGGVPHED